MKTYLMETKVGCYPIVANNKTEANKIAKGISKQERMSYNGDGLFKLNVMSQEIETTLKIKKGE